MAPSPDARAVPGDAEEVAAVQDHEKSDQSQSADPEKESSIEGQATDFPEGGLQAWLVAAGTGCVLFSTLGNSNSFGIFQAYYMQQNLETPDNIAWIGSTSTFLMFASGLIGGPLFDRYGAMVIRPAAVIYLVAVMMTSLCKEYWQFMLAQGVLTGATCGLIAFPAMAALTQYFNKKRGAAMGIAMTGSSVGAIVFPIVLSKLLNDTSVGFGWTVRIVGFIMMPFLIFASLVIKGRLPPRKSHFFLPSAFKLPTYNLLVASNFFLLFGMFVPLVFLPVYGGYHGMSDVLASYLVAMVNGASIPGRVIPGILGDKFGRFNLLLAAGVATTVLCFCWPSATSTAGIIVFSVVFGFCSGAIISSASLVLSMCPKDPKDIGTYMGQGMAVAAIAALIGLPITGVFLRTYDGFREISIFSGVFALAGSVLVLIAKTTTKEGLMGRI